MQTLVPILGYLFGIFSAAIVWKRSAFDAHFYALRSIILEKLRAHKKQELALKEEVEWLQFLLMGLRGGQSLDATLVEYSHSCFSEEMRKKSRALLANKADEDTSSQFLQESLRGGTASINTLQFLRSAKTAELRSRRKLIALTLGARLQAVILSLIPWFLLTCFFFIDPALSQSMLQNTICWCLWLLALLLCFLGFRWMRKILRKNIQSQNPRVREREEILPNYLLYLLAYIGSGRDIQEASLLALKKLPADTSLKAALANIQSESKYDMGEWRALRSLLRRALENGAPLRDELFSLLQEIQNQKESRWEELAQKLPLQLLAPLFACFFSACLLMCASLMVPFFQAF